MRDEQSACGVHGAVDADGDVADGEVGSAGLREGGVDDANDAGAAGDFHVGDGDRFDGVVGEDGGEFLDVVLDVVELGAGDGEGLAGEHLFVEFGVGEGDAVGGDEDVGVFPDGAGDGDQRQLHGPLAELRGALGGGGG